MASGLRPIGLHKLLEHARQELSRQTRRGVHGQEEGDRIAGRHERFVQLLAGQVEAVDLHPASAQRRRRMTGRADRNLPPGYP